MTDQILTVIGTAPNSIDVAVLDDIRQAIGRLGASSEPPVWLSEGMAADIAFDGLNGDQADAAARQAIGLVPIDMVAQPAAGRRKSLLLADMESTLIRNEMLDELASFIGLRDKIAAVTARAMNGELDFAAALKERVGLLRGLSAVRLDEAAARIELMPGAETLIATMRHHGAHTVLVSGGFRYFTAMVRDRLGIDEDHANTLDIEGGVLTGSVGLPILGKRAKYETLIRIAGERLLPLTATLSVGDGANDLEMLLAAGLGIAFRAKPSVAAQAKHRIDHADLTALLYAQGYRRDEFVV